MGSIVTHNLTKYYPQKNNRIKALDNVSVKIGDNQIVGLVGQNGSGKTTFVKSCTNLITFDGSIVWEEFGQSRKLDYKDYSAVLEGNRNTYWKLTVLENIAFFAGLRGIKYETVKKISDNLLKTLLLYGKKDCLVESLSRGMQQKTAIICTLVVGTPIIFLDEPTLGLDVESKNQLKDFFLHNEFIHGKLIFITSHDLEFIRDVASKHLFMKSGRVYDIDLKNMNDHIYKLRLDCGNDKINNSKFLSCIHKEGNCIYVDVSQNPLSETIKSLEQEEIPIMDVIKMNNDIETIYMDFIKTV